MLSFPFDSRVTYSGGIPTYDRAVSSQPLRKLLNDLFTTGVMPNPSTCFQVSAGEEGMTVSVSAGYAVINGGLMQEEETRILEVGAADLVNDRIDTVVLRWNENVDVREADLYIVAGTPSSEPVRPELTRSGSVYEIGLADLFIAHGTTSMSNERITDTRYESERCGIVSSVSEWDTTTIYQQVQADLAGFKSEEQAEFLAWFDEMKDQLSEDAAGHLQLEIDAINQEIDGLLKPHFIIPSDTGSTVTVVKDSKTITAIETSTGIFECDVTEYGDWTVNGLSSGSTVSCIITVNDVALYNITFIPNGRTVIPTDDVTTLLHCANIWDSEYTTISEILADLTTLSAVISSNNAIDYLVRSTTFASNVCADQNAMSLIGLNNYASNTLIANSTWNTAIQNSAYYESVDNAKIPTMTGNTTPSGTCYASSYYSSAYPYLAFDNNNQTQWESNTVVSGGEYIGYTFPSNIKALKFYLIIFNASNSQITFNYRITANNGSVVLKDNLSMTLPAGRGSYEVATIVLDSPAEYSDFRVERVSASAASRFGAYTFKIYGRVDV